MTMVQNRRNFLTTLSLAGAAGLAGFPRTAAAAEPPTETHFTDGGFLKRSSAS